MTGCSFRIVCVGPSLSGCWPWCGPGLGLRSRPSAATSRRVRKAESAQRRLEATASERRGKEGEEGLQLPGRQAHRASAHSICDHRVINEDCCCQIDELRFAFVVSTNVNVREPTGSLREREDVLPDWICLVAAGCRTRYQAGSRPPTVNLMGIG